MIGALFFSSCDKKEEKGTINIQLTDAVIDDEDVKAVVLSIEEVMVKGDDGFETIETFDPPVSLNIMEFQHGDAFFLLEEELEPGTYSEIRMVLDNEKGSDESGTYIEFNDGRKEYLKVPSGSSSGYKAKGTFTINDETVTAITLDFDLRKAVVKAGNSGKYILKPVIRLIENDYAAVLKGTYEPETPRNRIMIYAYKEGDFSSGEADEDVDDATIFPNAVNSDLLDESNNFTLAFMEAGSYNLVFVEHDEEGDLVALIGIEENVVLDPAEVKEINLKYDMLDEKF